MIGLKATYWFIGTEVFFKYYYFDTDSDFDFSGFTFQLAEDIPVRAFHFELLGRPRGR